MNKYTNLITISIISLLLTASPLPLFAPPTKIQTIDLNPDWQLQITNVPTQTNIQLNQKYKTNIPTTLHLDLLKYGKIKDPFFGDNFQSLRWVSLCTAKYTKKFGVQEQYRNKYAQLVFHGIDTYATIKLNGKQLLKTKNAFIKYTVRVQKYLKQGQQNILQIQIQSAQKYDLKGQQKNPMPTKYAQTRKPCYQYSWDWAPQLISIGISKNIQLIFFDQIKIDYVWIRNRIISQNKVILNVATKFYIQRFKNDQLSSGYMLQVTHNGTTLGKVQVKQQTAYLDIAITQPKFWWPNGIGEPYIYDFSITLYKNQQKLDQKQIPFGIRTAQLDLTNKQFKIKINNYPIYAKGANYVPLDMFYPRLTNKQYQTKYTYTIQQLLNDAIQSNFNMIRLWGGGQYQSNQFLQLASRKGIMIFYDFMFSDSIYPSTPQFLQNVQQQIKQQIRRTRNYPSLVLWSGNNQILQGIQDWGWGSSKYVNDYQNLFQKLIPKIIQIQNPQIPYIPSSPIYGVGNYNFQRGGDFHYWGVWAGGNTFQFYQDAIGPFNSQFGTQALPVWHTIKQFTSQTNRNYQSNQVIAHQRHGSKFNTLRNYINVYMKPSTNFQKQVYLSGIVQAYGIQLAIKAQRAAKPKCYGTLYWQFNDAWPAISWSSIDYYGRWKPLQYYAKKLYSNIAIFLNKKAQIICINDNLYPVDVIAKISIVKFDGTILSKQQKSLTLPSDSIKQLPQINVQQLQKYKNQIVIYTQIYHNYTLQMWDTFYFSQFKDLLLPKTNPNVTFKLSKNQITIQTDKLIKNLFIDHKDFYLHFSDNYFDVIPGFPITIKLMCDKNLKDIKNGIIFTSLREASQSGQLKVNINQQ